MKISKMNVVFIYLKAFAQTGGIETFNRKFIKALELIALDKNIKVTIIGIYDEPYAYKPSSSNVEFLGFNGFFLSAFLSFFRNSVSDAIVYYGHINLALFANLLYLIGRNRKANFIIHGVDAWHRFRLSKRFFMKNFLYLAVSNYTRDIFIKKNQVCKSRITLFPNCIDVDIDNGLSERPYNEENFNLLSVARLDEDDNYKGVDSIIKALSLLVNRIPNIRYTIIGKGSDRERLEILADQFKVRRNVEFKGFVENIKPYYEFCDLFVLPSNGEGFGIVYLEAMKYKKPVIAAHAGGAPDVVLHRETGVLCEYDNIQCLSENIYTLFDRPDFANRLGVSGFKHLEENFTFGKFRERLDLNIESQFENNIKK